MAIIKTHDETTDHPKVKAIYDALTQSIGMIPKPLQLSSSSPDLLAMQVENMRRWFQHPTLSGPLLAHIRLGTAIASDYPYCIEVNSQILKMMAGYSDEELTAVRRDLTQAKLEEKDKALALFAVKAATIPEETSQDEVKALHDLGWADSDIFEASFHAAQMIAGGRLFTAFKMFED